MKGCSASSPPPGDLDPVAVCSSLAEATQHLNDLFRAGRAGVISDDIENLTSVAPSTFRNWCERQVDEFR